MGGAEAQWLHPHTSLGLVSEGCPTLSPPNPGSALLDTKAQHTGVPPAWKSHEAPPSIAALLSKQQAGRQPQAAPAETLWHCRNKQAWQTLEGRTEEPPYGHVRCPLQGTSPWNPSREPHHCP